MRREACIHTLPSHAQQHRLRPDFQEHLIAQTVKRRHTGGESDCLTNMSDPVIRIRDCRADIAAEIGNQLNVRRVIVDFRRDLGKVVKHRFHQRRMKGVGNLEEGGLNTALV